MIKKLIFLITFFLLTHINIAYGKEVKFSQAIIPLDPHEYSRLLKLYTNAKKLSSQRHEVVNAVNKAHKLHVVFVKTRITYSVKDSFKFVSTAKLESQRIHYAHVFMKPG